MPLSLGLIGMPNAGKSTAFNALAQESLAVTAGYPFSTVDPNRIMIGVPDARLEVLGELTGQSKRIRVKMELVDIAGLVAGASRGEGLGNQFLDQTRHCDALVHVVGCFGNEVLTGAAGTDQLQANFNIVNQELMLSDLALLEGKIARLQQEVKNDSTLGPQLEVGLALLSDLESGRPIRNSRVAKIGPFAVLDRELRFISFKPVLILLNLDESHLADSVLHRRIHDSFADSECKIAGLCALLEAEMQDLSEEERDDYRLAYNLHSSGLQQIVALCFELLGLVRFFTLGTGEVRAWAVPMNSTAVDGAGQIHTDFARGFVAAEVISFDRLVQAGSEKKARAAGQIRIEGREYLIQDGDVIRYRFNV